MNRRDFMKRLSGVAVMTCGLGALSPKIVYSKIPDSARIRGYFVSGRSWGKTALCERLALGEKPEDLVFGFAPDDSITVIEPTTGVPLHYVKVRML